MVEDAPSLDGIELPLLTGGVGWSMAGRDALAWALELFEDRLGLPLPPMPRTFVPDLRTLGPALLGTRQDLPRPYELQALVNDLARDPGDYLLFGHDGHGANAWAMHYCLVWGPLALLVQIPWGGAYTDNEVAGREVARAFACCAALIEAPRLASLPVEQRLVVVESELMGSRWGLVPRPCDAAALAAGLTPDPAALDAALAWADAKLDEPVADRQPVPIWG